MLAVTVAPASLPADAQGPIRIGASLSLTGTYAKPASTSTRATSSASKELNAKGGLLGRKVEMVVYDDQSQPATGVRLYEKLITEDKVDAVMGPYSSPITRGGRQRHREVQEGDGGAAGRDHVDLQEGPQVHLHGHLAGRGLPGGPRRHGGQARAQDDRDHQRGHALPEGRRPGHRRAGQEDRACRSSSQEAYPKGNQDFSALLTKIKAANPDVLAAATYFDDAVAIARQMKELERQSRRCTG